MKSRLILCVGLMLMIGACALATAQRVRTSMESSKAAYTKCLQENTDLSKCETLGLIYQADLAAYSALPK